MRKELKKAIIDFMFENSNEFQLINATIKQFSQYIYTEKGEFCIGGEEVSNFIAACYDLVKKY